MATLTTDKIDHMLRLGGVPPMKQWMDPTKAAWYSWELAHAGQGPRISMRLLCPIVPRRSDGEENVRITQMGFEILLVASAGHKLEKVITRLGHAPVDNYWVENVVSQIKRINAILAGAPRCPNCEAALYPERVKSTGRLFWSCVRFPACKGMRRMPVTKKGRSPKKLEELR
jgi:hypothetical protein